jgi:hypothetical protein
VVVTLWIEIERRQTSQIYGSEDYFWSDGYRNVIDSRFADLWQLAGSLWDGFQVFGHWMLEERKEGWRLAAAEWMLTNDFTIAKEAKIGSW